MVDAIAAAFKAAKRKYDRGQPALADVLNLAIECLQTLERNASYRRFGMFSGLPPKEYWVAEANTGRTISRPFRPDLFIFRLDDFAQVANLFVEDMQASRLDPVRFDRVIYTAVTAFCLCYDVWKPKSRKTPGTFFEVLMGSAAALYFSDSVLTKHIPITGLPVAEGADVLEEAATDDASDEDGVEAVQGNSVSTDLVLTSRITGRGAVVPLKITTRERIVQPFAHQRILDSARPGQFASFLACISEVQRDDLTNSVKQVCVPGTVALFQKHLAALQGLYYCDIPDRYARPDVGAVIAVKPLHMLFRDIEAHLRIPFSTFV
ncbi:hypothetical protein CJT48_13225 [Pseudomonas aeruginosa]|nr:hypothetical protein CJT48_13225 [Pseudomonas aeruginosa]